MPHSTTRHGWTAGGPWLVSPGDVVQLYALRRRGGRRVGEPVELARTATNLNGMQRWGYITLAPDPADPRPKPPRSTWIIRATSRGRRAQAVWQHLTAEIESRQARRRCRNRWATRIAGGSGCADGPGTARLSPDSGLCAVHPPAGSNGCGRLAALAALLARVLPPSRLSSRANRNCRLPSAPMSCVCWRRARCPCATFPA